VRLLGVVVALLASLAALPGCLFSGCDGEGGWDPEPERPDASVWGGVDARTNLPPAFTAIEVPTYPPLGPDGGVTVTLHDESGLTSLQHEFRAVGNTWLGGTTQTVFIPARDLGDGFGDLQLTAYDVTGAWTRKTVENLVVDLDPPQIDVLPPSCVRPGDDLITWVSDGWLLGSVELVIGEVSQREDFPPVYPSYFGQQWDVSYVRFTAGDLPDGTYPARLTVKDAAGNKATESFELTIDGSPPTLTVLSPAPGATVSGRFDVEVAADDGGNPVVVIVRVDGVEIAAATGPTATITLDTGDFAPGLLDLEVEAVDEVGNAVVTSLPLTIPP
jgi:hypothetical protein